MSIENKRREVLFSKEAILIIDLLVGPTLARTLKHQHTSLMLTQNASVSSMPHQVLWRREQMKF